jgi:hypothetical protein
MVASAAGETVQDSVPKFTVYAARGSGLLQASRRRAVAAALRMC